MSENNRRSVLLINPKVQLSIIIYFTFISLILVALYFGATVYLFNNLNMLGSGLEGETKELFFKTLNQQKNIFNNITVWATLGSLLLVAVGGGYLSHLITGPVYRLTKHLEHLANEEIIAEVQFRKNDFFSELQESFNNFVNKLKSKKLERE